MWLNCDLGESYGAWKMPVDSAIMPLIDQANIACGFHAGDPVTLQTSLADAIKNKVSLGAHPSYPDREGFGRRSMAMSKTELIAALQYQISAISGMATLQGGQITYVKPHGALYNDLMQQPTIREAVFEAVGSFGHRQLSVMIQAHPDYKQLQHEADRFGIEVMFEAFADRRYTDEGYLVSRRETGAVLSHDEAIAQAEQLIRNGTIVTQNQHQLEIKVDSLCVHGDTDGAVEMATTIRRLINTAKGE